MHYKMQKESVCTSSGLGLHTGNRKNLVWKLREKRRRIGIRLRRKHPIAWSSQSFVRTKTEIELRKFSIAKNFNRNNLRKKKREREGESYDWREGTREEELKEWKELSVGTGVEPQRKPTGLGLTTSSLPTQEQ
ncbi:hypothetical protein CIPAW_07G160000 [Carya illinoinensis]|uniref:Uncharacterized protein n=1 Tax=Carya illinoinensis TaxID=32201 RepID=A0A8T1PVQ3_CARIL|nr:hypothetical protein CIPAW_07G160000 [Carya illinoinensis]